jgi:DNA invertase Pin-like site-specific DNA recombinase
MTPTSGQRAAWYLRASSRKKTHTPDGDEYRQRPEIQEERLRRLCEQRGWRVAAVYTDRASSRKEQRPELQRLMADARPGELGVVAVAAFDRFARSVRHLLTALDEFRQLGIEFVSLRESIDAGTPMGRVAFTLIGAMAELESSLISERTTAAMEFARVHGTRSGRPVGRQRRVFRRDEADNLLHQGLSYREVSRHLGVPVATHHAALQSFRRARSEKVSPQGGLPHSNNNPVPAAADVP